MSCDIIKEKWGDFMKPIDFQGFRFGNIHSRDLNLEVVTSSNKYENRILPTPSDVTVDIAGSDGQYLFGSTYKNREIIVNVAFDNISEQNYRQIRQLFSTDTPQDLVFDEEPYKTWKAKLKTKPEFKSLCFIDRDTGERVYKGDGKLQFICYFPYAFGFDKYIVKAADYYLMHTPETIICDLSNKDDDIFIDTTDLPLPAQDFPKDMKYFYNVDPEEDLGFNPNDSVVWKTGFPTIEQVQAGELYFKGPGQDQKTISDTRGYWDNIPLWQSTANLLTTPTLDYEQELMYLPQYSKTNYVNMEIGFQNNRPLIGSRLLVYNPGDIPIDWEINFDLNKIGLLSNKKPKTFKVRRFNVDRLTIPQAVDWCKMKPYSCFDYNKETEEYEQYNEDKYKYGNYYFARPYLNKNRIKSLSLTNKIYDTNYEKTININTYLDNNVLPADKNWGEGAKYIYEDYNTSNEDMELHRSDTDWYDPLKVAFNLHLDNNSSFINKDTVYYTKLNNMHPKHCYYIEPISRYEFADYMRKFYYQITNKNAKKFIPNDSQDFINRYEELLKLCITKDEEYELYWNTLNQFLNKNHNLFVSYYGNNIGLDFSTLFDNFINNPIDFIVNQKGNSGLNSSDEDCFTLGYFLQWKTQDYLEIDINKIQEMELLNQYVSEMNLNINDYYGLKEKEYKDNDNISIKLKRKINERLSFNQSILKLIPDLYYLNSEQRILYSNYSNKNGFNLITKKSISNEAIVKGKWFKIPPGWSLISIEPVFDINDIGNENWNDSRPFDWGYSGDLNNNPREVQQLYDSIYNIALDIFNKLKIDKKYNDISFITIDDDDKNTIETNTNPIFCHWYENTIKSFDGGPQQNAIVPYLKYMRYSAELDFLSIINDLWSIIAPYYSWTQQKGVYFSPDSEDDDVENVTDPITGINKRQITNSINDWWWYACNYIWSNFPPPYWSMIDTFNDIKIKYIPLFY